MSFESPLDRLDIRVLRRLLIVALVVIALAVPIRILAATPKSHILAYDSFSRTSARGWRAADSGGAYRYPSGAADLSVNGSSGVLVLREPGVGRSAELSAVKARNVEVKFRVRLDRMPGGAGVAVSALLRRDGANNEYRARARVNADGSVSLSVFRVRDGGVTQLGADVRVPGLHMTTTSSLWIRARVRDSGPTRLRIKAWLGGSGQPHAWQLIRNDYGRDLTAAGTVGVRAYRSVSATGQPVRLFFDDLTIRRGGHNARPSANPTPTPTPIHTPRPTRTPAPTQATGPVISGTTAEDVTRTTRQHHLEPE